MNFEKIGNAEVIDQVGGNEIAKFRKCCQDTNKCNGKIWIETRITASEPVIPFNVTLEKN